MHKACFMCNNVQCSVFNEKQMNEWKTVNEKKEETNGYNKRHTAHKITKTIAQVQDIVKTKTMFT